MAVRLFAERQLVYTKLKWHRADHATEYAGAGCKRWNRFFSHAVYIGNGFFNSIQIVLIYQPVNEIVMCLRNDSRGDIVWSLTGYRHKDAKFSALLNYLFKRFEPIILPAF